MHYSSDILTTHMFTFKYLCNKLIMFPCLKQVLISHMVNQVANKLVEKKKAESNIGSDSVLVRFTFVESCTTFAHSLLLCTWFIMTVSKSWHCCCTCTCNVEQFKLHYTGPALPQYINNLAFTILYPSVTLGNNFFYTR